MTYLSVSKLALMHLLVRVCRTAKANRLLLHITLNRTHQSPQTATRAAQVAASTARHAERNSALQQNCSIWNKSKITPHHSHPDSRAPISDVF
jgi:hypothetical protein